MKFMTSRETQEFCAKTQRKSKRYRIVQLHFILSWCSFHASAISILTDVNEWTNN